MKSNLTDRKDASIENFLRILRPILEEKGIIGKTIRMSEISKICTNRQKSLPMRRLGARDLTCDLLKMSMGHGCFIFDGLLVDVYQERDDDTGRWNYVVSFEYETSPEQKYLNDLAARGEKPATLIDCEAEVAA